MMQFIHSYKFFILRKIVGFHLFATFFIQTDHTIDTNKMNLVWVGNDFIEKGFMIKRKFPLFQGELYFWHENEVFNVREVRQNGVDSY